MLRPIPIGFDDFRDLRERGLEYVDKSHLLRELLDKPGVQVALLPRPRRFGKTLNLSMLRYFFEKQKEDLWSLFADLSIARAGDAYRAHFQRYPVIYLTFKGAKHERFEDTWGAIRLKIERLFSEHRGVLESGKLEAGEVRNYQAILDGAAPSVVYHRALLDLSMYLHRVHGEKVVLLIDEYDEPIHAGYLHGYAAPIVDFFRAFLTEGLKGNAHLFKGVLTGILRVARESIFSGLNNVAVYSLLRSEFNTCFGFTEAEVASLLERAGLTDLLQSVRGYYNGYIFGGTAIYNPWSILSLLASEDRLLRPYWLSTSGNDLVRELLTHHAPAVERDIETLFEGGSIERHLEENVALSELKDHEDALWSLLVFSGYLKAEAGTAASKEEVPPYHLSIPNREVRKVYATTFRKWMEDRLEGQGSSLRALTTALLGGDAPALEEQLQAFVTNLLSYHDTPRRDPERVYQAFLIGLFAALEPDYQVRSNRESGAGRPDVMIRPLVRGKPGVILELKSAEPAGKGRGTISSARSRTAGRRPPDKRPPAPTRLLEAALAQALSRGYEAELTAGGAAPVHVFAVAFDGKYIWVRSPEKASPRSERLPAPARRAAPKPKTAGPKSKTAGPKSKTAGPKSKTTSPSARGQKKRP